MTRYTTKTLITMLMACAAGIVTIGVLAAAEPAELVNSLGMRMVRIEPGRFVMGQASGGDFDERPVREVTISAPFYMAATEVTNAQYEEFDPSHRKYRGFRGVSNADDEAVTFVSWNDAAAFARWLSEKEGRPYRLPTEAEWEYACRAGTTTPFHTGERLPEEFWKNQFVDDKDRRSKGKRPVSLTTGSTPPNPWGLHEMHGNVEEWVLDWHGTYPDAAQTDPVGPSDGDFKVSRGGSHNTSLRFLRSANRHGSIPEDKHWILGFRVVQGSFPSSSPLSPTPSTLSDASVDPQRVEWERPLEEPLFREPIPFVVPDRSDPWLSGLTHHHCPSLTWCDNGDLLAVWFSTRSETGREMLVLSSRLRHGSASWDTARLFFDVADRNDTGSTVFNDGRGRLFFLQGVSESSRHHDQSLVMSVSTNSGQVWSRPRIISSLDDRRKYTPMDSAFVAEDGSIVVSVDTSEVGERESGSTVFVSRDGGVTWTDQTTSSAPPTIEEGGTGALIAGFHPGVVQLRDGRLLAYSRRGDIGDRMTKNLSPDMGRMWSYSASEFPGIWGGQRLVLLRLREGPLLFVSFTSDRRKKGGMSFPTAGGGAFTGYGMYAALSFDEGETWPVKKLLTTGGPARTMDGGGNTHEFVMDDTHAETAGYLAATQTPDGIIHLISSRLHYRFNLAWLKELAPASFPRTGRP
jgi:formylglycine-generating enzyme required for sulfatase activity